MKNIYKRFIRNHNIYRSQKSDEFLYHKRIKTDNKSINQNYYYSTNLESSTDLEKKMEKWTH